MFQNGHLRIIKENLTTFFFPPGGLFFLNLFYFKLIIISVYFYHHCGVNTGLFYLVLYTDFVHNDTTPDEHIQVYKSLYSAATKNEAVKTVITEI